MRSESLFRALCGESQPGWDDAYGTILVTSCVHTTNGGYREPAPGDANTPMERDEDVRAIAPIRLWGLRHERERCLVAAQYEIPVPPHRLKTNALC